MEYNLSRLIKFVDKYNLVLLERYRASEVNANTKIYGLCIECKSPFKKGFRTMVVSGGGPRCVNCVKKHSSVKYKNTCFKLFGGYPMQNEKIVEKRKETMRMKKKNKNEKNL